MEYLRYPIGRFSMPEEISKETLTKWIKTLEELPARLRSIIEPMNDEQLNTLYRPEGWSVRELVHHIADSHHHSYIRFKWALTENNPTIKPYDENAWSKLPDIEGMSIEWSLKHIEVIHYKLVRLLKKLTDQDLKRTFLHPASGDTIALKQNIGIYAWHSEHHFMHIKNLIGREKWNI